MLQGITEDRRSLHRIPELGFDLPRTQAYVMERLFKTRSELTPCARSGVLAYFDFGRSETVAFRSDMDALPVAERAEVDYRSECEGRMHACGHDAHMAMLLALARYLDGQSSLPNNILLIFQPAEESGGGANDICETGALEKYKVKRVYAFHVDPDLDMGVVGARPGPLMAGSTELRVAFYGKSAHVAMAREGKDALFAASDFLMKAYRMEREIDPEVPRLLKFGSFHAGNAPNIVADRAELVGSMRSFDEETFAYMRGELERFVKEAADGVEAELELKIGYPPLVNDEAVYAQAAEALAGAEGITLQRLPAPSMLAEDFSFYLQRVPGMMMKLGIGTGIPLHSPDFFIDERALVPGVKAYIRLARMP